MKNKKGDYNVIPNKPDSLFDTLIEINVIVGCNTM